MWWKCHKALCAVRAGGVLMLLQGSGSAHPFEGAILKVDVHQGIPISLQLSPLKFLNSEPHSPNQSAKPEILNVELLKSLQQDTPLPH